MPLLLARSIDNGLGLTVDEAAREKQRLRALPLIQLYAEKKRIQVGAGRWRS